MCHLCMNIEYSLPSQHIQELKKQETSEETHKALEPGLEVQKLEGRTKTGVILVPAGCTHVAMRGYFTGHTGCLRFQVYVALSNGIYPTT